MSYKFTKVSDIKDKWIKDGLKMVAIRADVFMLALFFCCSMFLIKKVFYVTSDGFSITLGYEDDIYTLQYPSFGFSSLFASRKKFVYINKSHKTCLMLMIILCGDIETLPGPSTNPIELTRLLDSKGIHLFHQNICGLFYKKALVEEFLNRSNKIDILTLSETHIDPSEVENLQPDEESVYDIPGYTFVNKGIAWNIIT